MSILRNAGYLQDFLAFPCASPSPLILIRAAFEAAPPVIYELIAGDWEDYAYAATKAAYFGKAPFPKPIHNHQPPAGPHPPRSRNRGHGARFRGKAGRRSYGRMVDPVTAIFDILDAEQSLMWWWLVADMYTEFLARWTTLIYLKQGCLSPHTCYAEGTFNTIYYGPGTYSAVLPLLSAECCFTGGTAIQTVTNDRFSIQWDAELRAFGKSTPPSNASIALVDVSAGKVLSSSSGGQTTDDGAGTLAGGFQKLERGNKGKTFAINITNNDPSEAVSATNGHIRISCGLCNNTIPTIPFDLQHLPPRELLRTIPGMR